MEDDLIANDRIIRSLDHGIQLAVHDIPLAKDKFQHLEAQYGKKDPANAFDSWMRLNALKLDPTTMTWNNLLTKYYKCISEVLQHGVTVTPEQRKMTLSGAVSKIINVRQITGMLKREDVTEKTLVEEISSEYQRMRANEPTWKRDDDDPDTIDNATFAGLTQRPTEERPIQGHERPKIKC